MSTNPLLTGVSKQINAVLAADTPLAVERPGPGSHIITIRGTDGDWHYGGEVFGGARGEQKLVVVQEAGDAKLLIGNKVQQAISAVSAANNTLTATAHKYITGETGLAIQSDNALPAGFPNLATAVLTGTANFGNTETVDTGAKTYTFQTTLTDSDGNVQIGGDLETSLANLAAAINLGAGSGSAYAASTTANPAVRAIDNDATTLTVEAKRLGGTLGNAVTVDTNGANASWDGATLSGGASPFIIKADDDTFQVAASHADAIAGTVADLTSAGAGTITITGVHNIAFPTAATILDGTAGVPLSVGVSLVLNAPTIFTIVGDTDAITTFYWV